MDAVSSRRVAASGEVGGDGERALVAACRRGDVEAFGRLVERHQRSIFRLCCRMVNHHEDAADLTQEVFLRAFRSIARFRAESSVATWLYRIAVNLCNSFRARRPAGEELAEDAVVTHPAFIDGLDGKSRARAVREAIARLPERQRATLVLKTYHELTHEQIGEILGTSVGTAKANLFHALANLRRMLKGRGLESGGMS
jgi:RNA polymerase sigma-70 factor (ECF subfamily)